MANFQFLFSKKEQKNVHQIFFDFFLLSFNEQFLEIAKIMKIYLTFY